MIVSGSSDLRVRITDATTGNPIHDMEGHTELVRTMEFNMQSGRILSGSYDSTLIVSSHSGPGARDDALMMGM
jgi:WD40 repeat protein